MGELLYGVSPTDPVVFSSVIGVIALVGFAACWLPARRAAALDPLRALRHD
jgi:ABC-type antimicrobial peptide transport system permease subunit